MKVKQEINREKSIKRKMSFFENLSKLSKTHNLLARLRPATLLILIINDKASLQLPWGKKR